MWSAKMFVQALRIEWQPDPESPRRIRRYGPNRARSEVVHCPGVKNRSNRSHRISCVVHNHFCRHQETVNKTTANLTSGGGQLFHREYFFVICAFARSLLRNFRLREGTWRLHRQVAASVSRTTPDVESLSCSRWQKISMGFPRRLTINSDCKSMLGDRKAATLNIARSRSGRIIQQTRL